jgi:hypothetical protein
MLKNILFIILISLNFTYCKNFNIVAETFDFIFVNSNNSQELFMFLDELYSLEEFSFIINPSLNDNYAYLRFNRTLNAGQLFDLIRSINGFSTESEVFGKIFCVNPSLINQAQLYEQNVEELLNLIEVAPAA